VESTRGRRAHVPNTTVTVLEVFKAFARPCAVEDAERKIGAAYGCHAVLFASGRAALAAAIEGLADGQEVAIPGYTCAAVANAVIATGRRPRFVDVDVDGVVPAGSWPADSLAIVQDTYGFRAAMPNGARVIRDAAHRFAVNGFENAAVTITSFEHSKWLSAGQGGLALTNDSKLAAALRERRGRQKQRQHRLRHELVTLLTLLVGRLHYRGRFAIADPFNRVAYKLGSDRLAGQSDVELRGSGIDPKLVGPPNRSVARLVLSQLARMDAVAAHRTRIVAIYDRRAAVAREPEPLVRYPLSVDDPDGFERWFLEHGWDVRGRWFSAPLHPAGTDLGAFGYEVGSAPVAEQLAATVVNLPTHPLVSDEEAEDLIDLALAYGARPLEVQT
jgi:perosamine synthetase